MLFKELRVLLSKNWWQRFAASESLTDGLRNTLLVTIPVLLLWPTVGSSSAMAAGVGALLVSLTDAPGNRNQKINAALRGVLVFGITAISGSYLWDKPIYCALFFFVIPFAWSMLASVSNRAWLTGSLAIILGCFIVGLKPKDYLEFSYWIIIGSVWYFCVSLIQVWLQPFRSLRYAIRECLNATSDFLLLKEACYDNEVSVDKAYQLSMVGHLKVSEHQEAIRELLLSDSLVIKKESARGRRLLTLALEVMSLYEHVSAMSIDYEVMRNSLSWQVLTLIRRRIGLLAEWTGILATGAIKRRLNLAYLDRILRLETDLTTEINWVPTERHQVAGHILTQLEQHIKVIVNQLKALTTALKNLSEDEGIEISGKDYLSFWDNTFVWSKIKRAFDWKSPIFKFSLRMALMLSTAYLFWVFILKGDYGYWLLLTIVVVARPRFGITWKRNAERLLGTAVGAIVGLLLLFFIPNVGVMCTIAAIFLWGYFSFNRFNYTVSVFFVTVAVLVAVGLLSGLSWSLWLDRLWFTVWGCAFSVLGLFVFPFWERWSVKGLLYTAKTANDVYLSTCLHFLKGDVPQQQLALSRKLSHTALARLSEGINWSWLEPGRGKLNLTTAAEIQLLLYRINAAITALWVDPQHREEADLSLLEEIYQMLHDLNGNATNLSTNNSYEGLGLLSQLVKNLKKSWFDFNTYKS